MPSIFPILPKAGSSAEVNDAMLAKLKNHGVLYSAGIAINRVVPEFIFRTRVFYVLRLGKSNPLESRAPYDDGVRFQWCENESQRELAKRLTYFKTPASGDHKAGQPSSYRACLAFDGDEAVGGVWIASGSFEETGLRLQIQLQPQQHWLFAANIIKSHRQRGIYGRMLRYVLSTFERTDQSCEILASINPTNKASMAAHGPMIDEILGKCVAARFLFLSFCLSTAKLSTIQAIGIGKTTQITIRTSPAELGMNP